MSPSRRTRLEALFAKPFAHRGLHGRGIIENSRAAFRAAIQAGHGIELDVQASADGEAIVFHDYELGRLTDVRGKVADRTAEQLAAIPLKGEQLGLPTLAEIIDLVRGDAAVLVEVKSPGRRIATISRRVDWILTGSSCPVAVMSFNPSVSRWFAKNAPEVLRGLVVTEGGKPRRSRVKRAFALWWSKADFLAYDIRDLPSASAAKARADGMKVATWTVRTEAQRETAASHADQIIYEVPV